MEQQIKIQEKFIYKKQLIKFILEMNFIPQKLDLHELHHINLFIIINRLWEIIYKINGILFN